MSIDFSIPLRPEIIEAATEALRLQLIVQRRDFHTYPELSNYEERTSRIVAERLYELGFDEVMTGVGGYGVVALLKGVKSGPVVAVRADMDALPIQDINDVPYKSRIPGVKHACGHDVHTAIQLGVAAVLTKMRDQIPGSVKFIFQPAEEGLPDGEEAGAFLMIKQGALENPRPSAIFCLHVMPTIEVGQIAYRSGPVLASSDHFTITVRGKKAHGASPHEGVDAVLIASECVIALQTIRSRRIDPADPLVISVGVIQGGNRFNIIADEVRLEGTVRTLSEDVRQRVKVLIRETVAGVTSAFGSSFELNYNEGPPVAYNNFELVRQTLPTLERVVGDDNITEYPPLMASDDFSLFQQLIPGFYFFLGTGNQAKGITAKVHTSEFDVDEECLVVGVKVMSNILLDYLSSATGEA